MEIYVLTIEYFLSTKQQSDELLEIPSHIKKRKMRKACLYNLYLSLDSVIASLKVLENLEIV